MIFKRELYTYQGQDSLPNESWHKYFTLSTVGKEYEVLYEMDGDEIAKLVMSNTEYELKTNIPFLKEVQTRGPGCRVLSIGYGIGFINEVMKSAKAHLTVIEKYQEVLDLEKKVPDHIDVVVGDANHVDLKAHLGKKKFDVIFCDITNHWELTREKDLREYLDDGGRLMYWTHMN